LPSGDPERVATWRRRQRVFGNRHNYVLRPAFEMDENR
jgi:hypothetical protein